ncbi:LOW QUALITY PROTEIN: ubiquitin carboxyl-terminal hydrolase 36-like [Pogoniulus pusillus]|uniref:LOW QUALITY PROTEIN: ubiquitin carboxyl-terminal hydrolase 36-like n=1 Tax=Pogoniulus pusillus TaxID=488313 RepID=UPI0030B93139
MRRGKKLEQELGLAAKRQCLELGSDQAQAAQEIGVPVPQQVPLPGGCLCMQWPRLAGVGAGLRNLGRSCFLNATLQCLTHTAPLASYLLCGEHGRSCHREGFCMLCTMQTHVGQAFASSGQAIKPEAIIRNLKNIAQHFSLRRQEDAHEFLRCAIDAMQQACGNGCAQLDGQSQAPTLVQQIFGGSLRSRVLCLQCQNTSDTYEPYLDCSALPLQEATSVVQALEQFVQPELLCGENAYMCARCQQKVSARKGFSIHQAANVLTVALKRFAPFGGGKITKAVAYPMLLNVRPYLSVPRGDPVLYSLYAVLVHSGHSCHAGHYYCYVKASSGQLYLMNDERVCPAGIQEVLGQQPYLLFYQRVPSPRRSWQGPTAKAASSLPGCTGGVHSEDRKSVTKEPLSSAGMGQGPGLLPGEKPPGLEEAGVPVAHSLFGMEPELCSGSPTLPKLPAGSPAPSREGSAAVCQDYWAQLQGLTRSSKSSIARLTLLAQQNVALASSIVSLVEARVAKAPPAQKLPALYLMDSILKNVGGEYLKAFAPKLVETFVSAFQKPEESSAAPSATSGASAAAAAAMPQAPSQEQLLRQQLLVKEKQVLELRQKLSELEQAGAQLEEPL